MAEARVISRLLIMGIISLIINSVVVFPIVALSCINVVSIVNRFNTPYTKASVIFYSILILVNIVYMGLNVVGSSLSSLYKSSLRNVGVTFLIVINSILAIFFAANLLFLIIEFATKGNNIHIVYGNTGIFGIAIGVCQCCLFVYGIIHIVVICKNRETTAVGDGTVISHLFVLGIVSKIVNLILLVTIATISCILAVYYTILSSAYISLFETSAAFHWIQFLSSIAFLVTNTIAFTLGYLYKYSFRLIGVILLAKTNLILPVLFVINVIMAGFAYVYLNYLRYISLSNIETILAAVICVCQIVLFVYNIIHTVVIYKSYKLGNRQAEEIRRNELTEI